MKISHGEYNKLRTSCETNLRNQIINSKHSFNFYFRSVEPTGDGDVCFNRFDISENVAKYLVN